MFCTIQIYLHGSWRPIARYTPFNGNEGLGYAKCGGHFEYIEEYVFDCLTTHPPLPPVSLAIPVSFSMEKLDHWPAFLLDLVPTGFGREEWRNKLRTTGGEATDWELLTNGAQHPVGWLRVIPGDDANVIQIDGNTPGFSREEVSDRDQSFLEYAISRGASVSGSSDVQGESPKLLLTDDENSALHADGALADHRAKQHWLVKFARKRTDLERKILRNEAGYLRLAAAAMANVHKPHEVDLVNGKALFIPRFDRRCSDSGVIRFGMESFASAAGIPEFGVRVAQEALCDLILRYSSSPAEDLLEYLRRDILNICLGNTDNHTRNHAFLKTPDGQVRLSPLYDFAPMFLSDEGYPRVVRWEREREAMAQPDWLAVGNFVAGLKDGPGASRVSELFGQIAHFFSSIAARAQDCGIDADVVTDPRLAIAENVRRLDLAAAEVLRARQ